MDMESSLPEEMKFSKYKGKRTFFDKGSVKICRFRYTSKFMHIARIESRDNKRHIVSPHIEAFTRNDYPTSIGKLYKMISNEIEELEGAKGHLVYHIEPRN